MDNIEWFQTEEGQEWLVSKEHYYWIEGGKRGLAIGLIWGIPAGMILMGVFIQFGLI